MLMQLQISQGADMRLGDMDGEFQSKRTFNPCDTAPYFVIPQLRVIQHLCEHLISLTRQSVPH